MVQKRKAVVAGSFYDANKESLSRQIKDCFLHEIGPGKLPENEGIDERKTKGVVSPHAGFMFSGPIAAYNYLRLSKEETPQTIIILGPNHRGLGADIAIMSSGQWETPLGIVEIDQSVANGIMKHDEKNLIVDDQQAHTFEHSIEVQLPFLQYIYPSNQFKIVPICITNQQIDVMQYLSEVIYNSTRNNPPLLIASSDFTHYEEQESAKSKDIEAIDTITSMDSKLFYNTIRRNGASICGPGAIAVVIEVCEKLGITKGQLLKYATSGDISGMYDQVVGYASIIFQ